MIGLKRNTVKVIPYEEGWNVIYKETEIELYKILKEQIKLIEHVGSTAVKGMAAKPIIDIAITIEDHSYLEKIREILILNDYEDRGENKGGYLFVKRIEGFTTHHLHFVLHDSLKWKNYLSFKNKLNSDIDLRETYSQLKQDLAEKFADDRGSYTESKSRFIAEVLRSI